MNSAPQMPGQEPSNNQEKPKLSRDEEIRIRDQIDSLRNDHQVAINEENQIRDRVGAIPGAQIDDYEEGQIGIAQRKQVGIQAEIDRLNRQLSESQLDS